MIFTFDTMRTELLRRLGGRTDATSRVRAATFLNAAQAKLAEANFQIPRCESTAAVTVVEGEPEITLNSLSVEDVFGAACDIIGIRLVQRLALDTPGDTGIRMKRMSWRAWREIEPTQATGPPTRWARNGWQFAVDPSPDTTYTLKIDYRKRPPVDELVVNGEWQETMLTLAEAIGWRAFGQPDLATAALGMLPRNVASILHTPLDYAEWEALWDDELGMVPRMA